MAGTTCCGQKYTGLLPRIAVYWGLTVHWIFVAYKIKASIIVVMRKESALPKSCSKLREWVWYIWKNIGQSHQINYTEPDPTKPDSTKISRHCESRRHLKRPWMYACMQFGKATYTAQVVEFNWDVSSKKRSGAVAYITWWNTTTTLVRQSIQILLPYSESVYVFYLIHYSFCI